MHSPEVASRSGKVSGHPGDVAAGEGHSAAQTFPLIGMISKEAFESCSAGGAGRRAGCARRQVEVPKTGAGQGLGA